MKLLAALMTALGLIAQQPPTSQSTTQPPPPAANPESADQKDLVIRETLSIVIAPTTVVRPDGTFVTGLEPKDFKLLDNGKLQTIRQDVSYIPISMVVAIQRSAATEQVLPSLKKMGAMLEQLVLGEEGEAAIIQFDHRVEQICDFTNDSAKFNESLQNLRPGGRASRLNDAVIESVRLLKNRPANRRRVVLLIAETKDNGSGGRLKEALTDVQMHNVMVYPVNMSRWLNKVRTQDQPPRPSPVPPSALPPINGAPSTPNTAMQLGYGGTYGSVFPLIKEIFTASKAVFVDNPQEVYAKYTGTAEENFVGLKGLEDAMHRIGEELQNQYLLSYNPNNKIEGGYHTIQVQVNRPGVEVRTRGGYWMAGVPY